MANNFYQNYTFPFNKSSFLSWFNNNYFRMGQLVGYPVNVGSGYNYTSAETTGTYLNLDASNRLEIYRLYKKTRYIVTVPHFYFFETGDGHYDEASVSSCLICSKVNNQSPVAPTFDIGDDLYAYAIKLRDEYYIIALEKLNNIYEYELFSTVDPVPSTFEPLETVSFTTQPKGTIRRYTNQYNSLYFANHAYTSNLTVNANFSSSYNSPGIKKATISYDSNPASQFEMSITISNWHLISYSFESKGISYSLYTGKIVGQDFLDAYKIKCLKMNSLNNSLVEYPKTSLELSKISKKYISESDSSYTFSYDISDITESSTTSITFPAISNFHKLANGTSKFNNIYRKTSFEIDDVIGTGNAINANSGSLTYDDGTTISLQNVTFQSSTVSSSLGVLPQTVDVDTPSVFTITYNFTLQYFGALQITDTCSTEESAQVARIELVDFKHEFIPSDIVDYGSNAKINVYNSDDELIKTINRSDFQNYVLPFSNNYGKKVTSSMLKDGVQTLRSTCLGMAVIHHVCVSYDKATLSIEYAPNSFIFDPTDDEEDWINFTTLVVKKQTHANTYLNDVVTTTITETTLLDEEYSLSFSGEIDVTVGKNYGAIISHPNEWGQALSGTFTFYAEPLEARYVYAFIPSGTTVTSNQFYNSGVSTFVLPSGFTMEIVYNDPTQNVVVNDYTDFDYFRDENLTEQLAVGDLVDYKNGSDNKIYVRSKTYKDNNGNFVVGSYAIDWQDDYISEVNLNNQVIAVLGNRLNKIQSQITLDCTHISGNTTQTTDFVFNDTSIMMFQEYSTSKAYSVGDVVIYSNVAYKCVEATSGVWNSAKWEAFNVEVKINNTTYEIKNSATNISWAFPYGKLTYNFTNFPTDYNNNADKINPNLLGVRVEYYEENTFVNKCDYAQDCTYSSTSTDAINKFTVSTHDFLSSYTFGTTVEITMNQAEENTYLTISVNNAFKSGTIVSVDSPTADVPIRVFEILEVVGIKLLSAKREYNVGDVFLNEDDDTELLVFYKDTNDDIQTTKCLLRNSLTALNINPLKGTVLNQIIDSKVITISSAINYNVSVQYTISVKANYVYSEEKTHNAIALFLENYLCPDNVTRTKYFLVERTTIDGIEAVTTQGSLTGEWRISDGVNVDQLIVLGYLEDIGDQSKNAKVILFKDYIPLIEGSNNIDFKFPCYVEGNADLINNCHFGIMFGNNNSKNRLFVSGNSKHKNKDWHSGQIEKIDTGDEVQTGTYGYFEDLSVCEYGETDNAVIGYDIVSNDKLLVLKNYSDKETTVYFRQPQLVTAINSSGTSVTGLDDETLYQEEFSLSKGNNSVAGVNPKSIINFNGDSLFISKDKEIVGLDLTGIIGDNQRYANTRSYFIDEDLKNYNLSDAIMWSNNKYLFVALPTKVYVTHFELRRDNQYEWFVIDVANVSSILEKDDVIYFGTSKGEIFRFTDIYKDATKVFVGYGLVKLSDNEDTELFTASSYLNELDDDKQYYFKPVPFNKQSDDYIYYSLGTIENNSSADCDFYVDNSETTNPNNVIELVCIRNGETDEDIRSLLLKRISENIPVFFNKKDTATGIIRCRTGATWENAWGKEYYLKEFSGDALRHLYQIVDVNGQVVSVTGLNSLWSARICLRVTDEKEMVNIDKTTGQFQLKSEGEILNIVQYNSQPLTAFRGEIIEYKNVEAFYITKPYTLGTLEYLKTVWSFTLTNDSNIPSELDLCYATNKIPMEEMKTLANISKDMLGFSFEDFNFATVDFDKNVVPRTYTHKRVLSGVKFVCFGFRNYKDSNSVLSSMTITYTLPYPSYGGD